MQLKKALQQSVSQLNLLKKQKSSASHGDDIKKETLSLFGFQQSILEQLLASSKFTVKQLSDIRQAQIKSILIHYLKILQFFHVYLNR